jgi:hypothetical protein
MDEEGFEALWHTHYADILAFCLRRLGYRQEAADATAERSEPVDMHQLRAETPPRDALEVIPGAPIPAGATGYTVFESPVLVDSPGERPS